MITAWFAHLSWSHAALLVLAVLLLITALSVVLGKCCAINEEPKRPTRHASVVDHYAAKRQEKIEWLGPRYLLHKPINRRGSYVQRT